MISNSLKNLSHVDPKTFESNDNNFIFTGNVDSWDRSQVIWIKRQQFSFARWPVCLLVSEECVCTPTWPSLSAKECWPHWTTARFTSCSSPPRQWSEEDARIMPRFHHPTSFHQFLSSASMRLTVSLSGRTTFDRPIWGCVRLVCLSV